MKRLQNKAAVVTGGNGGIGRAVAQRFLEEGARLMLVDLQQEALNEAADSLGWPDELFTVVADVSDPDSVARYVTEAKNKFGGIDVFFNNAGIEGQVAQLTEQTVADFDRVIAVNLRGMFLGLKNVLPVMQAQGAGSIINTSSIAGLIGEPGLSPYVASKHAVVGLTKSAALEAAANNVRVNSIHPSPVNTRMMRSIEAGANPADDRQAREQFTQRIPMQRYAEAKDIANLVAFLASDESSFISGSQYRIDGGMAARS